MSTGKLPGRPGEGVEVAWDQNASQAGKGEHVVRSPLIGPARRAMERVNGTPTPPRSVSSIGSAGTGQSGPVVPALPSASHHYTLRRVSMPARSMSSAKSPLQANRLIQPASLGALRTHLDVSQGIQVNDTMPASAIPENEGDPRQYDYVDGSDFKKTSNMLEKRASAGDSLHIDPKEFKKAINVVWLTFRCATSEVEYTRSSVRANLVVWRAYVSIGLVCMLVAMVMDGFLSDISGQSSSYTIFISPILMLQVYFICLLLSFSLSEERLMKLQDLMSLSILLANALGGAIVQQFMLASSMITLFKPAFLFIVAAATSGLLLRLRLVYLLSTFTFCYIAFVVTSGLCLQTTKSSIGEYVFIAATTFATLACMVMFSYDSEKRARQAFYHSRFYAANKKGLTQQLKAVHPCPVSSTDLDSPLEKASMYVRKLIKDPAVPEQLLDDLKLIMKLIQMQNPLGVPDLQAQLERMPAPQMSEQENWLRTEVLKGESQLVLASAQNSGARPGGTPLNRLDQSQRLTSTYGSMPRYRTAQKSSTYHSQRTTVSLSEGDTDILEVDSGKLFSLQINSKLTFFSKLEPLFARSKDWNWAIFEFARETQNSPLLTLSLHLFQRYNLFQALHIPIDKFARYMWQIERGYDPNLPYHNSVHACDVLHSVSVLLECERTSRIVSDVERCCLFVAAAIHDYQHLGFSNKFLSITQHPLAVLYNDKAIMENHHASSAIMVLQQPDKNFVADWPAEQAHSFRSTLTDLVLITEILGHFDFINPIKSRICSFAPETAMIDRALLWKLVMKASDVSNPTREPPLYFEWTCRIMQEFFIQGDEERSQGLLISPWMDSTMPNVPACQMGFINFVVDSTYDTLNSIIGVPDQLKTMRANYDYFAQLKNTGVIGFGPGIAHTIPQLHAVELASQENPDQNKQHIAIC